LYFDEFKDRLLLRWRHPETIKIPQQHTPKNEIMMIDGPEYNNPTKSCYLNNFNNTNIFGAGWESIHPEVYWTVMNTIITIHDDEMSTMKWLCTSRKFPRHFVHAQIDYHVNNKFGVETEISLMYKRQITTQWIVLIVY